jgi:ADP-ribose pyrophosphatase YjhB (NUDIX family)
VAVALVIEREGHLLLIRRNQNPEKGKWSVPAGFVDAGEDPARAAEREALEETGLHVRVVELLELLPKSDPVEVADILLVYRAEIVSGALTAGDDAEVVRFFGPDDLPTDLAFGSAHHITAAWKVGQSAA